MGNSTSAKNFSLHVDGSDHSLMAGSTLSGTVKVHVPEGASEESPLAKTHLLFIGKEDVKVHYTVRKTVGSGDSRRTVVQHRNSFSQHDIVRMAIPLQYPSDIFKGGNFEIPFQFQIPDHIPSSFQNELQSNWCKIRYKLKLDIKNAIDLEIPLVIKAKPADSQPVPNLVPPFKSDVRFCCIIPRGEIFAAANVDDTRVGHGEMMKIDVGVKNNSRAAVEFVSARISQKTFWISKGHRKTHDTILVDKRFSMKQDMTALRKSEMQKLKESTNIGDDEIFRELYNAVKDGTNQLRLQVPARSFNTYHGKLIQVNHYLTIQVKTPTGSTDPTIQIPLKIVTPNADQGPSEKDRERAAPVAQVNPDGWDVKEVTTVAHSTPSRNVSISFRGKVEDSEQEIAADDIDLPPVDGAVTYDYPSLLKEVESSLNVRSKLQDLLKDEKWRSVIVVLIPNDFVEIVRKVELEFDKVEVIDVLAAEVKNFSCDYATIILRTVPSWLRIQVVQRMIPHIVDLKTNKGNLLKELSDWERLSTENDFENAMNG